MIKKEGIDVRPEVMIPIVMSEQELKFIEEVSKLPNITRLFEENEAFGRVFLNNKDEVVLLPDKKNSAEAQALIAHYENEIKEDKKQSVFLRLDKSSYTSDDKINFTGHIFNKWNYKPVVKGSVLTVQLKDEQENLLLSEDYDMHKGAAFGQLDLSKIDRAGRYNLYAKTNIEGQEIFKTEISINKDDHIKLVENGRKVDLESHGLRLDVNAESNILITGVSNKMVFNCSTSGDFPIESKWKLVDDQGNLVYTLQTNKIGLGSFNFVPKYGKQYFLEIIDENLEGRWAMPAIESSGMHTRIGHDKSRSIKLDITQKPALPQSVYILSTFNGKVFSVYEKWLHGMRTTVDLPVSHLPGGINKLVVVDKGRNVLSERSFYISPARINFEFVSAKWKSKRSHRAELAFRVSDDNGKPVDANLSVVCFHQDENRCDKCDIRNEILLPGQPWSRHINFDHENDSMLNVIDELLILSQKEQPLSQSTKLENYEGTLTINSQFVDSPLSAEVSLSGSMYTSKKSKRKKSRIRKYQHEKTFWIPRLNINEEGIATIELKLPNKNQDFDINIQGISDGGLIGYFNLEIDPSMIKYGKIAR